MAIIIENPTAEGIIEALRHIPHEEVERLRLLLNAEPVETADEEDDAWHRVSLHSAARFFEEEEGK